MKVLACACGFLLSAAFTVNADERLTMAVSPIQSFAPTNAMIRVHVTPNAANRGLQISADSGEYYRSSWIQLDGQEAPKVITVELRSLPRGDYEIRGALIDSTGRACAFANKWMTVLPSAGGD